MRSEQGLHGHDWWRLTIRLRTLQAPIGEAGGADTDWEPVRETDLRVTGPILPEIRSRATRQESHERSIWVYPPFGRVGSLAPPTVIRVVKASNVGGLTW